MTTIEDIYKKDYNCFENRILPSRNTNSFKNINTSRFNTNTIPATNQNHDALGCIGCGSNIYNYNSNNSNNIYDGNLFIYPSQYHFNQISNMTGISNNSYKNALNAFSIYPSIKKNNVKLKQFIKNNTK